jgi:hypothetical protein
MIRSTALAWALLLSAHAGVSAPPEDLASALMAVEKARYAFAVASSRPFEEVYSRAMFEARARRLEAERRVLFSRFGIEVTPAMEAEECARIDRSTKAPEQWAAIQRAIGSRGAVERFVCGPALVGRLVRSSFSLDPTIHAAPHEEARAARKAFLSGGSPEGANRREVSRQPGNGSAVSTEKLLADAKAGRVEARTGANDSRSGGPELVNPELAALLEKELGRPGDVTRIFEEPDRFTVFRLVSRTDEAWGVDAFVVAKLPFDPWLEEEMKSR